MATRLFSKLKRQDIWPMRCPWSAGQGDTSRSTTRDLLRAEMKSITPGICKSNAGPSLARISQTLHVRRKKDAASNCEPHGSPRFAIPAGELTVTSRSSREKRSCGTARLVSAACVLAFNDLRRRAILAGGRHIALPAGVFA